MLLIIENAHNIEIIFFIVLFVFILLKQIKIKNANCI